MNRRQFRRTLNQYKGKVRFRSGLNFRRKRYRLQREHVSFYGLWILEVVAVILAAFLITKGLGMRVTCSGESMTPAIVENGTVWVNRFIYRLRDPKRGEVVVFLPQGVANASYNVKRIVALPGEKVQIRNGQLYINDKAVDIKDKDASIKDSGRASEEIVLGKNEYFVLGDNVNNSEDSRYETVGNVARRDMYGKAWFVPSLRGFGFID